LTIADSVRLLTADGADLSSTAEDPTRTPIPQVLAAVPQFDKSVTVLKLRAAGDSPPGDVIRTAWTAAGLSKAPSHRRCAFPGFGTPSARSQPNWRSWRRQTLVSRIARSPTP
jgi:hypothetical protein